MKRQKSQAVDFIFILGLFCALCCCAVLVVLLGANVYKKTTQAMDLNFTQHTGLEYIVEKFHQNDMEGGAYLDKIESQPAIVLKNTKGQDTFCTYIYYYNGYLRELSLTGEATPLLSAGQKIVKAAGLDLDQKDAVFTVSITATSGEKASVQVALVSERGGENGQNK